VPVKKPGPQADFVTRPYLARPDVYQVKMDLTGWMLITNKPEEDLLQESLGPVILREEGLAGLVAQARLSDVSLRGAVDRVQSWEARGLTYKGVHVEMTGEELVSESPDGPYHASEDLAFTYYGLSIVWAFINQAEFLIEWQGQTSF
jgi:hypothetical protein